MADKLINSGDVYTNPVGDNVVVIDPNKILVNGEVKDRLVDQEDLVMYANLSARIFPRSKILAGGGAGDEVVIDVFDGELNFLKPKGKDFLDSDWTEAFTNPDINKQVRKLNKEGLEVSREIENQNDFQGFGITSINVKLNSSYIPQVTINFTDIRGKTLFEQARVNTPYTAFFHLPYPTFFLTLKGFYGKAVKYQLTLEKFTSRFDPSSGDYLVTCDFKGNHIAMLRDINMHEAITAPYMYPNQTNTLGGITSTKGREVMSEVYSRYKQKNLLDKDFPEYTLVELIEIVKNLDNDLGKLYGKSDLTQTSDKVEYDETLKKFKEAITGKNSWEQEYLDKSKGIKTKISVQSNDGSTGNTKTLMVYPLKFSSQANNDEDKQAEKEILIQGATEKLNELVAKYVYLLDKNPTFREDGTYPVQTVLNDGNFNLFDKSSVNSTGGISVTLVNVDDQSKFDENKPYFLFNTHEKSFENIIKTTRKLFEKQAEKLSDDITTKLNTKLEKEIGFRPTIRNVFAIILAGADTFLKLLDQTHTDAFNQRFNESRLAIAESSDDVKENQMVFPWPQYYVTTQENKCTTSSVLTYPGAKDVVDITKGDNKVVWPEIHFVEEYTKTTAYKFSDFQFPTSNAALEKNFTPILIGEWPFMGAPYESLETIDICFGILDRADMLTRYGWYNTRLPQNNTKTGQALEELSDYESQNIYNLIKDYPDLLGEMGRIGNYNELGAYLLGYNKTIFQTYILNDGIYDPQILSYVKNNVGTIKYESTNVSVIPQDFAKNYEALKEVKHLSGFYDLVPAVINSVNTNYSNAGSYYTAPTTLGGPGTVTFYSVHESLYYDNTDTNILRDNNVCYFTGMIPQLCGNRERNFFFNHGLKPRNEELKDLSEPYGQSVFYTPPIDNMYFGNLLITEGPIRMAGNPTQGNVVNSAGGPNININIEDSEERITSMLNTPYFINSIIEGVGDDRVGTANAYRKSAYLFLNSLPLPTFREKVGKMGSPTNPDDLPTYISSLFNQLPAVHQLPLALLLRIGSVWWRYKTDVQTTTDPLQSMWGNLGRNNNSGSPAQAYDTNTSSLSLDYTFIEPAVGGLSWVYQSQSATNMMVGVYPQVIDCIHFIATGQNGYTNMGSGQVLNNILGPTANLNISTNVEMGRKLTDGTDISFHDVYLDSNNITNPNNGASFNNQVPPERYYILYPSSGGLLNTDASLEAIGLNDVNLHNGACKLFWKGAHYGYFAHRASFIGTPGQYLKNVNPTTQHQPAWNFNDVEVPNYSTIEELFAVFSKSQLDEFESLFLSFSESGGSVEGPLSSMKEFIKEITIIPESFIRDSAGNTNTNINDVISDYEPHNLANAQYNKLVTVLNAFLLYHVEYAHQTTNNLDSFQHGMTSFEATMGLIGNNISIDDTEDKYNFGRYIDSAVTIPPIGSFFVGNPQVWQDVRLNVGRFYSTPSGSEPSDLLAPQDESNPIYKFFTTCRGAEGGIEFTSKNVEIFAPVIRMYASYCATVSNITADKYLKIFGTTTDTLEVVDYVDGITSKLQKLISTNIEENETRTADVTDDRPSIEADNLKLELYTTFKTLNDRWVAGTDLTQQTLFERFLFFDRANRDIGDEAIINIWDIIQLDSPFGGSNTNTLTQSVASYLSTILANNYFNFIPLPAYINFFNVANDNSQLQGNAMFGTFKTVDYLESQPAFLCQYVGPPSSQLKVDTPNNGYKNDSFTMNRTANNPLLSENCGDKQLSNKVMGFNVDFGIPNQNIFESITLDQSQFQDTSESFKILQDMADSGGGGATSTASLSLFNIYSNRSYKASVTCIGNVAIQPTQYFQLRYLPMFNGPYLILNVEHNITPNNIETSFEGVRVPIPTLPKIDKLVQRVNKKIYQKAEQRFKDNSLDLYLDNLSATKNQLNKTPLNNGYVNTEIFFGSDILVDDQVQFNTPIPTSYLNSPIVDPEVVHLGYDFVLNADYELQASTTPGVNVTASIGGIVIDIKDGCNPLQNSDGCGEYGNYVVVKTLINENPTTDDDTSYYITRYAFLRKIIGVKKGDTISKLTPEQTVIGQIGNSGLSEDIHLHFEILRYVKKGQKIIKHYLQPQQIVREFNQVGP